MRKSPLLLLLCFVFPAFAMPDVKTPVVSGCQQDDYIFVDELEAAVGIEANRYTPKCLAVVQGTQVTIEANGYHPLNPQPQAGNPINQTHKSTTVQFNEPGIFGYYCPRHGNAQGRGMAGAIWVLSEDEIQ